MINRRHDRLRTTLLAALAVAVFGACGDSGTGPVGGGGGADAGETPDVADDTAGTEDPYADLLNCQRTDECDGQVCDKRKGGCVECYADVHCPDGDSCRDSICRPDTECSADADCPLGVCDPDGLCTDCNGATDCATGMDCVLGVCRPEQPECTDFQDCAALGGNCDSTTGRCVSCDDETQCGDYERCDFDLDECLPDTCVPSVAFCVGDVVHACRADGKGSHLIPCGEGEVCSGGECINDQCEPGTTVCNRFQLEKCLDNGTLVVTDCPPGQECVGDSCQSMRHRVMIIIDTSGSMVRIPGTNVAPDMCGQQTGEEELCFEAWPVCEQVLSPFTVMGHSKRAFAEIFKSQANDDVLFGLQRFPQVPNGTSPGCFGDHYDAFTQISGDDDSVSVPLETSSWFDEGLEEVVIVPFPQVASLSNLFDLINWIDFEESAVPTDDTCNTNDDCEDGVCVPDGPVNRCYRFDDPELRPNGWTPLGKSLFYAGEYMRKYVVVDGKECTTDADCGSAGYYCSEAGKCFDPLRSCRLNAVVLFTDGGETEHEFFDDYFSPWVQAKKQRFGLGCETDDDCSQLPFCVNDVEDMEFYGCHDVYCHETGKYCTHKVMEADPIGPLGFKVNGPHNRLLDYNGNPIQLIVNVVDASTTAGEDLDNNSNRFIALNGGGLHVIADVDDAPSFVAEVQKTIDMKTQFTLCAQGLGEQGAAR